MVRIERDYLGPHERFSVVKTLPSGSEKVIWFSRREFEYLIDTGSSILESEGW